MTNWLLLTPTEFERNFLTELVGLKSSAVEICGFGPILAGIKTAELIGKHRPDRVLLLGIAGSYRAGAIERLPGSASLYSSVACYGVGAGDGDRFETAAEMGWPQWKLNGGDSIGESIQLNHHLGQAEHFEDHQLLTVCAASGNKSDVKRRQDKFPDAVAEDMEGFAVAAACQCFQLPLTIVRGISNVAGDRNKSNWKIKEALEAAQTLAIQVIQDARN